MSVQTGKPSRTAGIVLLILGGLALLAGLVLGLSDVPGSAGSCGSVFSPRSDFGSGINGSLADSFCARDRGERAGMVWTLVVAGVAGLVAGGITSARVRRAIPPAGGIVAELERLAELHSSGALDDEEFEAAKRRILGSTPQ